MLQENIAGFREGTFVYFTHSDVNAGGGLYKDAVSSIVQDGYFIKNKWVKIIVDGIELDPIFSQALTLLDERRFLESHNAEDIKGIELNFSPKYNSSYLRRFVDDYDPIMKLDYAFIEITTRSGHGPFFGNTPGMYLYKPLPVSWPGTFYKPKYIVSSNSSDSLPDFRSTIHWEPNISTDSNGEATVTFFSANKPSTYTLILEGIDMNGNLGYKQGKIEISDKLKEKSKK